MYANAKVQGELISQNTSQLSDVGAEIVAVMETSSDIMAAATDFVWQGAKLAATAYTIYKVGKVVVQFYADPLGSVVSVGKALLASLGSVGSMFGGSKTTDVVTTTPIPFAGNSFNGVW